MRLTLERKRRIVHRISPRTLAVAGMFGLGLEAASQRTIIPRTTVDLAGRSVVFITGPSGSGKSTLLRQIAARCARRRGARVFDLEAMPALPHRPLVDCFEAPLARTLGYLSVAGLGDAFVMLRRPGELSDGQRYRLRLAQVLAAADADGQVDDQGHKQVARDAPQRIIVADEFASTLDRPTARCLAQSLARWARQQQRTCIILATTHDDLLEPLAPDLLIEQQLGHDLRIVEPPQHAAPDARPDGRGVLGADTCIDSAICIEPGGMDDYRSLAEHHYRAAKPGGVVRVLRAVVHAPSAADRFQGFADAKRVIGVLVESTPMLDCHLRHLATAGRYSRDLSGHDRAVLLNRELRCISRVVVDPRYRGIGLAVRLVRHALATATTSYTEALAAMGHVHPFFEKAGMTAYHRPPHAQDARLADLLTHLNLALTDLVSECRLRHQLRKMAEPQRDLLRVELTRWSRGFHRSTTAARDPQHSTDPIDSLIGQLTRARLRLLSQPVYYLHRNAIDPPASA